MDISSYIGELLYEHDCVIIPGFGGFICSYRPSVIHEDTGIIRPPSKEISFNKNLVSNDGLLINYISTRTNLPFQEAAGMVSTWVSSADGLLRGKETLVVNNIGIFFNDKEGNLQFSPSETVNYLKASFGLKNVVAYPVVRDNEKDISRDFTIRPIAPESKF